MQLLLPFKIILKKLPIKIIKYLWKNYANYYYYDQLLETSMFINDCYQEFIKTIQLITKTKITDFDIK